MADIETTGSRRQASVLVRDRVLRLVTADITTLAVEAFVFYARSDLSLGSGFGTAIARRGGPAIKKALDALGPVAPTQAVVTTGGALKATHIVHAVGPAFQEAGLEAKLRATIENALRRAEEQGIRQVALPPMGAGFYGVPLAVSATVMVDSLVAYLSADTALAEVIICANDRREYLAFEGKLAAVGAACA